MTTMVLNTCQSPRRPRRVYTPEAAVGLGLHGSGALCDGRDAVGAIADLPSLVKVLLSRKGDDATRGSQSQCASCCKWAAGGHRAVAAAACSWSSGPRLRRSRPLDSPPTPVTSKRGSFDQTPPATQNTTRERQPPRNRASSRSSSGARLEPTSSSRPSRSTRSGASRPRSSWPRWPSSRPCASSARTGAKDPCRCVMFARRKAILGV